MPRRAASRASDVTASLPIENDELHRDEVDAFVARNRDALNASFRRSRAEFAAGDVSKRSMDDIIADCRRRHGDKGD